MGEWMDMIAWVLVVVLSLLCVFLARRRPRSSTRSEGQASAEVVTEVGQDSPDTAGTSALRAMARYLRTSVLSPLEKGIRDGDLRGRAQDAADALRDLCFHAEVAPEGARQRENLIAAIQGVTREYTLETGTPVKFSGPDRPVYAHLATERFKDALFLLLANAGHFGGGQTIEVSVEDGGDGKDPNGVRVRVGDRGPGFSGEALSHAFEPFWTSDTDALGLGLTQAKALLEGQGAAVRLGNRENGGGEVVVSIRREV